MLKLTSAIVHDGQILQPGTLLKIDDNARLSGQKQTVSNAEAKSLLHRGKAEVTGADVWTETPTHQADAEATAKAQAEAEAAEAVAKAQAEADAAEAAAKAQAEADAAEAAAKAQAEAAAKAQAQQAKNAGKKK